MLRIARPRRAVLDLGPAALIVIVWAFLWAWMLVGVMAPLSRVPDLARTTSAEQRA
jgi:hypothetical protein